jgi:hypothetical protein
VLCDNVCRARTIGRIRIGPFLNADVTFVNDDIADSFEDHDPSRQRLLTAKAGGSLCGTGSFEVSVPA